MIRLLEEEEAMAMEAAAQAAEVEAIHAAMMASAHEQSAMEAAAQAAEADFLHAAMLERDRVVVLGKNQMKLYFATKLVIWARRTKERFYTPGARGARMAQEEFQEHISALQI